MKLPSFIAFFFTILCLVFLCSTTILVSAEDSARHFLLQDLEAQVKILQQGVEQLNMNPSAPLRNALLDHVNTTYKFITLDLNQKVYFNKDDPEFAGVLNKVGDLLVRVGAETDGLMLLRDGMEMRKRIAEKNADAAEDTQDPVLLKKYRRDPTLNNLVLDDDVAQSYHDYGVALELTGKREEGLLFLENALKMRRRMYGHDVTNKEGNRKIAESLISLGNTVNRRGQYEAGTNYLAEALDIHKQLNSDVLGKRFDHQDVANAHSYIAHAFTNGGDFKSAITHHTQALDMHTRLNDKRRDENELYKNENLNAIAQCHSDIAGVMAAMPDEYSIQDFLTHLLASVEQKRRYLQDIRKNLKDQTFIDHLIYVGRSLLELSKSKERIPNRDERESLERKGKEMIKEAYQISTLMGKPPPPEVVTNGEQFFDDDFDDF